MNEPTPPRVLLQVHLLVALLATTALLGELLSLPAARLVAWRTFLAALGAAFVFSVFRRKSLRLPARQAWALLGIGAIIGLHWLCFFGAVKVANVSICLAGLSTLSFFTAFTEPLLEKRRLRPLEVALGVLILGGIVLIANAERGHLGGLGLALLSALLAAFFPVLNRRAVNHAGHDPLLMVAWEMAGACAVCLAGVGLFEGAAGYRDLFVFRGFDWLWLLLLAWVCTVFAHGYHIHLLRRLSAYTINLALNFEPVYGIAAAALLFGEHRQLGWGFFAGASVLVTANFLHFAITRRPVLRQQPVRLWPPD